MISFFFANFASFSESSAVGSALRSGRRGRAFESPLSDFYRGCFSETKYPDICFKGTSPSHLRDGHVD